MKHINALRTTYDNISFESRTEARWYIFLKAVGWPCEYENEGFQLSEQLRYLPDFDCRSFFLEIKGVAPDEKAILKAQLLAKLTQKPVLFGVGNPDILSVHKLDGFIPINTGGLLSATFSIGGVALYDYSKPIFTNKVEPIIQGRIWDPDVEEAVAVTRSAKYINGEFKITKERLHDS